MALTPIQQKIRYLTNGKGEKTDVVIPIDVWESLLELLPPEFDPEDSKEAILADLKEALLDGKNGKIFPISELWHGIDIE